MSICSCAVRKTMNKGTQKLLTHKSFYLLPFSPYVMHTNNISRTLIRYSGHNLNISFATLDIQLFLSVLFSLVNLYDKCIEKKLIYCWLKHVTSIIYFFEVNGFWKFKIYRGCETMNFWDQIFQPLKNSNSKNSLENSNLENLKFTKKKSLGKTKRW